MFTGIIEELGKVAELNHQATGARLRIESSVVTKDAAIGSSISVNGACLTAVDLTPHSFSADVAPETLKRTNFGGLQPGSLVNLERPLAVSGRLDGHFVLGHVDGTAELLSSESLGDDNWWLRVRLPEDLTRYVVSKGSLAIDGISLTVAEIDGPIVSFTIIPHTWEQTALHSYKPGDRINIEVDVLAKHLEKLIASR